MSVAPRLLLVEGTPRERRRAAAARGLRGHAEVYAEALRAHYPTLQLTLFEAAEPGARLPAGERLENFAGLVIGGSNLHACDPDPEVTGQVELLRAFGATGRPMLASCWGLQVAVVAAGGAVAASANGREVGIARKLTLTDAGRQHPMYAGKPAVFDAPCMHYDEVTRLPEDATLLCHNPHSPVQAAVVPLGRSEVWGVQYHPEFDLRHVAGLIDMEAEAMLAQGFFQDAKDLGAYTRRLAALDAPDAPRAMAWPLGIDRDLLDVTRRRAEIVNWVRTWLPTAAQTAS